MQENITDSEIYSQEMESEPLVLELEEEGSDSGSVSEQTKKVLKWLPVKNKYMFYAIIAFLERLRSEDGVSDETVEFYYSKLPMFETPDNQKAFLESMVDIKRIEKDVYRPLVKEHKKTVRETLKQEQKVNKKKAKETVVVESDEEELSVSEKKTEPKVVKEKKEKVVKEKVVKEVKEKVVKEKVVKEKKEKVVKEKVVKEEKEKKEKGDDKEPAKQRGRKQKTITVEFNNENTGTDESTEIVLDTVVDHLMEKMTANLNTLAITTPAPVVEVTPAPVVDVTPAPVVEVTPAPVVEVTPAPVVEVTLPENSASVVTKKKAVKKTAVPKEKK